jgi:DNA-binding transcriptional MerR regulator
VDTFLSVADASRILGVTPQTVRLMIRRGTLIVSARTVGGIQLFSQDEVERLAAERRQRQEAKPQSCQNTAHVAP